jgi:hypothetical protein
MAGQAKPPATPDTELLQKLLAVQLYYAGTQQRIIARIIGRRVTWVNALLRGVPKPTKSVGPA